MKRYVIGIDYGTLSGRVLLLDALSGEELAGSTVEYSHGVLDETLPDGQELPPQFALQHPGDYLDVLRAAVPEVLRQSGVSPSDVAGLGIDFTSCTLLPVDANNTPLCLLPEWEHEKHAYVKLWKHHASQPEADEVTRVAAERGEKWLSIYGGKISSEWAIPKILQTLREAPEVYAAADRFTEAGEWITRVLTGKETHGAGFAGYKALWNAEDGFPSDAYFRALDPRLGGIVGTKISAEISGIGGPAGVLSDAGAKLTGLEVGTPLSFPMLDAHAAMPALGITGEGTLMLIVGTSGVHMIHTKEKKEIPGICGYVRDSVVPGYYTYEAGQSAVGDIFDWFVKNNVPASYEKEAAERGIGIHRLLREKASRLRPGESGLIALDWVNGNRCVLVNAALSGLVLGMTLRTKPEEIYRAWIEATAYGTRKIMEQYEAGGIRVDDICAAGGIAQKDEMMMQIYADVTGRSIRVAGMTQAGALGSAIYASVAGGIYPTVAEAAKALSRPDLRVYHPNAENRAVYDRLYAEYIRLHDYFGSGENPVMEKLTAGI